jgi:hypothetical protein
MAGEHVREAFLVHHHQGFTQAIKEADRRRERCFALLDGLQRPAEIPEEDGSSLVLLDHAPRLGADAGEGEARRTHQRLL